MVVTGKGVEVGDDYGQADEVIDEDVGCCHGLFSLGFEGGADTRRVRQRRGMVRSIPDFPSIGFSFCMLDTLFILP